LQDERLAPWLERALDEARAAGLRMLACCGTDEQDWHRVLALAGQHDELVAMLGLHPWHLPERSPAWLNRLEALLRAYPELGVGEIGLHAGRKDLAPMEEQEEVFMAQVRLAHELGRPVAMHGVRAWQRVLELLRPLGPFEPGYLLHAFSGPAQLVPQLAELGAWFSFSGTVTRHKARRVHEAVRAVPAERLLIETDAPDILPILGSEALSDPALPRDERGKVLNLPGNLPIILRAVAELRGEDEQQVAQRSWDNAQRLYAPLTEARSAGGPSLASARTALLLGAQAAERLAASHVVVVGMGAVGSYAVEALARAGVGALRLADFDRVDISNLNRQLYALHSTVGRPKVQVARERVLDINPRCRVQALEIFAHQDTAEAILQDSPDLVIDAIDSLTPKLALLEAMARAGLPVLSSMGAALRTDPSAIRVGELADTRICPLARHVRKRLRRRGIERGVRCVYSLEPPRGGDAIGQSDGEDRVLDRGRVRNAMGSLPTITGIFGLTLANEALRMLGGVG